MQKTLSQIKNPSDLKKLSIEQLMSLARDIRSEIIRVVSQTGGHLASSLGAVELTLALHYCLDTPHDKLIWDVGHQAYAHKLLTGRSERFETLRQKDGISGFLKPHESEYDVFGAGHASTSLAAGLGMARARDLTGEDFKVVSVIGDGSMTCGLVYEALNTAGLLKTNFMVVMNDNEMSIAKNVGAIPQMFNRVITGDWYNYAKERIEGLLAGFRAGPHKIGEGIIKFSHRVEEGVKGLIVPGLFFEELGFRYFGPIDGHDLGALIPALNKTLNFKGPRILHVMTKKGKGYFFAEKNPEKFHSAPPFHIKTGERKYPSGMSFTLAFGKALVELAEKDKRIIGITAAMSDGTGLSEFAKRFPERFYDFGIAESAAVVTAAGMAIQGLKPVVAIYSTFLQRAYDMVIHDVALQNLPVIFALDRGGIVGQDGPTHHGVFDISYLRIVPNMVVASPRSEEELRDMLFTALAYEKGPFALRYPRGGSGLPNLDLKRSFRPIPIPSGEWLRQGEKAALIGYGPMANNALLAAGILEKEDIEIGVANARFVKPLDEKLILEAVDRYDTIFSIEDNVVAGGFGSAVNEFLVNKGIQKNCQSLGFPDRFIEHGTPDELYEEYGISPEQIAKRIRLSLHPSL
ncbi:1-deoxy-D-xylulose-5-phosphate synthase [Candidatus Sumerlaeota bacterium]|nr:1-deoxy-D-xylulose-5-phosphate synthase [Candidatus Sumerlaeota bacterium]